MGVVRELPDEPRPEARPSRVATLLRMNAICVIPITLVLFSVAPVQTWERFWRIVILVTVVSNANFALLTLFHRRVWVQLRFRSRVLPYLGLALFVLPLIALVCAAAARVILTAFGWLDVPTLVELLQINVPLVFVYGLAFFFLRDSRIRLAGVSSDLHESRRDNVELALERDEMKLFALQVLLNPHFLFNSLNTVAALIHENPAKAEEATILLSRVLRRIVERRDTSLVCLETELQIVTDYLGIEKIRLGDRFTFTIDVPSSMRNVIVPAMIMQPLVENAIHHGIRQREDAGHVLVRAWTRNDECHIEVTDDGPGVSSHHGTGEARRLLETRLEALYGRDHYALELFRDEGRRETTAAVCIPLRTTVPTP